LRVKATVNYILVDNDGFNVSLSIATNNIDVGEALCERKEGISKNSVFFIPP
jgi:hypothetical protein